LFGSKEANRDDDSAENVDMYLSAKVSKIDPQEKGKPLRLGNE
jgi:hypothetical protein